MQFLSNFKQEAGLFVKENATLLLTTGGVVGTVGTAVLAARGGMKYAEILRKEEEAIKEDLELGHEYETKLNRMTKIKLAVPYFGPPVILGGVTIGCIVMSHRMSAQKIAGLAAAYGLAERNFSEYKEKVAEKLTGPKNKALGEEISQDRVNRTDGYQNVVIIEGEVLCFDEATDRYFNSTMEKIRSAVNATNAEILNGMGGYADASFFYNELGLKDTKWSGEVGWNSDHLCELKYDTIRAPDGRPCISIIFENFPKPDFIRKNY